MIASSNILSCNSPCPPLKSIYSPAKSSIPPPKSPISLSLKSNFSSRLSKISPFLLKQKKGQLQICRSSSNTQTPQDPPLISSSSEEKNENIVGGGNGGGDGGDERDWTTSFLLFAFWAGLMYYVFALAPDQTPVTDLYFLKKLLNLKGDDGFEMNQVLVALWYIMGLWPLVYSMLLLPTARRNYYLRLSWVFFFPLEKQNPSLAICFSIILWRCICSYPYFVLWRPPAPPVEESELRRWPLNFLESKLTAGITVAAGLAIMVYAFSSGGEVWKEFYQYFKGSKFIHIMSIDFGLLSTFAPFWVYNDMTARKWDGKSFWLLPLSLIPFLGPALYILLRPSLPLTPMALGPTSDET
ncbi:hypothetical protein DH2020_049940 [Rehmannia glutinosa]|uniref:Cardiolipin synthase N-terminal domain-containing protein n=1 Tax=Rehmannia glutinosa TaxID=99300 RepID=A0ABR0U1G3_REHGL